MRGDRWSTFVHYRGGGDWKMVFVSYLLLVAAHILKRREGEKKKYKAGSLGSDGRLEQLLLSVGLLA